MSEPSQPPVTPPAHLPAVPQYPSAPQQGAAAPQGTSPLASPTATTDAPQPRRRGDASLGLAAFVIALVTLTTNLFASAARPLLFARGLGLDTALLIESVIGMLSFVVYLVALGLGSIAARRTDSRLLPGIAIGIAGAGIIALAFGWVSVFLNHVA